MHEVGPGFAAPLGEGRIAAHDSGRGLCWDLTSAAGTQRVLGSGGVAGKGPIDRLIGDLSDARVPALHRGVEAIGRPARQWFAVPAARDMQALLASCERRLWVDSGARYQARATPEAAEGPEALRAFGRYAQRPPEGDPRSRPGQVHPL